MILYALADGSLHVLKTENGEKVFQIEKKELHYSPLVDINWIHFHDIRYNTDNLIQNSNSFLNKLILPISPSFVGPNLQSDRRALLKLQYLKEVEQSKQFSILLSSDSIGYLILR